MTFFFVGERPSPKALAMKVRWQDGRLAAKQLFDALQANGIEPASCRYDNVFRPTLDRVPIRKPWLRRTLCRAMLRGETIVAMGQLVSRVLADMGVKHLTIIHPAARGKIRAKARYAQHMKERLLP